MDKKNKKRLKKTKDVFKKVVKFKKNQISEYMQLKKF